MYSLYLLIDIFAVIIPLIFSFHPRIRFYRHWRAAWSAILLSALFFIPWDILFSSKEIWGFNPLYITGIQFMKLPLEEVLFFICIPYACLFTYFCLSRLRFQHLHSSNSAMWITYAGTTLLLVVAAVFHTQLYTFVTFLLLSIFLLLIARPFKEKLGQIFLVYLILLIPFFIVNGILTGTGIEQEVVWYNNQENMGIRVLTIPVEDFFYGMLLILMNIVLFEILNGKKKNINW
jgi:lycopene cyclase domain-containing protein